MAPLPWARICLSSCFMQVQTPRRLIAFTRSNISAGSSAASMGGLDASVVERHVQPTEGGHRLVDHRVDLVLLGDVADHTERLVAGGGQVLGSGAKGGFVDVGQDDGGAGFSEGLRGGQAHSGAAPGDQGDLTGEVVAWVHGCSSLSSRLGQSRLSMLNGEGAAGVDEDLRAGPIRPLITMAGL
jgi:hypothetical protein